MSKAKHRKSIHRMNKLLLQMMDMTKNKHPTTTCAVCCAVLAITYKRMDEDSRTAMAPVISECFALITEDQMQTDEQVH
jgi:hypothetical protein